VDADDLRVAVRATPLDPDEGARLPPELPGDHALIR
jgi:hypothetical protein